MRRCSTASRAWRASFADPWSGVLLWAPFGVLALVAVWLLVRSCRERLSRSRPDQVDVESSALLLTLICGAVFLVAVVASPSLDGPWYAARDVLPGAPAAERALCALGLPPRPAAPATSWRSSRSRATAVLLVAAGGSSGHRPAA